MHKDVKNLGINLRNQKEKRKMCYFYSKAWNDYSSSRKIRITWN